MQSFYHQFTVLPVLLLRLLADGGITDRADAVHNLAMGGPAE